MSRERFELIMNFLHFTAQPKFNLLANIRMIIDTFNGVMLQMITPDKNLSLDELMMLWRRLLIFRKYIKTKRHNKYGIKF